MNQQQQYQLRIEKGTESMANSSVVICSLVRDCENSLIKNIPLVEKFRALFKTSTVVVVENDSVDNTKVLLKKWKEDSNNVVVISEDYGTETIPEQNFKHPKSRFFSKYRIEKMAKYRNIYLDYIKCQLNPDYVIMIDLDIFSFSLDGIKSSFGFEKTWHSINANGKKITPESVFKPVFYDAFAFQEINDNKPQTFSKLKETQIKLAKLTVGDDFIKVKSGFNGLAIYKWESIKTLTYRAEENKDEVVLCKCEHLTFHEDMIKNGDTEIFLNPSMVVDYELVNLALYFQKLKNKLFK